MNSSSATGGIPPHPPRPQVSPPHEGITTAGLRGLALYGLAMGNCCEPLIRFMEEPQPPLSPARR